MEHSERLLCGCPQYRYPLVDYGGGASGGKSVTRLPHVILHAASQLQYLDHTQCSYLTSTLLEILGCASAECRGRFPGVVAAEGVIYALYSVDAAGLRAFTRYGSWLHLRRF